MAFNDPGQTFIQGKCRFYFYILADILHLHRSKI